MNSETERQPQDQGAELSPSASCSRTCRQGRRVRPEPDFQEALRERVRHARRRALRRADRRLRVHQPSRRHRHCWQDVERGRGGVLPVHLGGRPRLFGFDSWRELSKPRDLEKIFDTIEYTKWNVVPRLRGLAVRHPGDAAGAVAAALRRSAPSRSRNSATRKSIDAAGSARPAARPLFLDERGLRDGRPDDRRLRQVRLLHGHPRRRGRRQGRGSAGATSSPATTATPTCKCPTEIGITDRREAELSKLGFLPLCHYKNTDYAVFFGAQTTQKPKKYDRPEATANAAISARLPYIMATSRFAHYLKVIARDKIGSFKEASDVESLAEALDQELRQRQSEPERGGEGQVSAARGGSRSRRSPASRAPTTRWRLCGRGCSWRS